VPRLLLLADTHVPARARDLPAPVWRAVAAADVVVHAGDWVAVDLLDRLLERLGGDPERLVGVHGNNDGPDLRARLPEVARAEIGGVRFAVVHETGPAAGRERRCEARHGGPADGTDVLVFGHSHIPWDTVGPRGLRLLNPGSPTDRRRQPECTYLTATAEGGRLSEVRLHAVPRPPPVETSLVGTSLTARPPPAARRPGR
jgi:putative phosphoesterase